MGKFLTMLLMCALCLLGPTPALADAGSRELGEAAATAQVEDRIEPQASTATVTVSGRDNQAQARQLLDMVNAVRSGVGSGQLNWDVELERAAQQRAAELSVRFSHTRPDGSDCWTVLKSSYYSVGENIALGYSDAASVNTGWTNSQGHYENMINGSFHSMGAASFVYTTSSGWSARGWVELFSSGSGTGMTGSASTGMRSYSVSVDTSLLSPFISMQTALGVGDTGTARAWQATQGSGSGFNVEISGPGVVWSSSNPAVLEVGADGAYRAVAPGSASLRLAIGGRTFTSPNGIVVSGQSGTGEPTLTLEQPAHGRMVSYDAPYEAGEEIIVFLEPSAGYEVSDVRVTGVGSYTWGPAGGDVPEGTVAITFTMPAGNVTVSASLQRAAAAEHAITVASTANGTVRASGTSAAAGEAVSLTVTPSSGYRLGSIAVTDASGGPVALSGSGTYRMFTMPDSDVRVTATFLPITGLAVTHNSPEHGRVSVSYDGSLVEGTEVTVVLWPDNGYVLESITAVNTDTGARVSLRGSGTTRMFTMPEGSVRLVVSFSSLSGEGGDGEPQANFTDVHPGDWFYETVAWASQHGLMNGEGAGTAFRPNSGLTRAEMAQILYNANGRPAVDSGAAGVFPDCATGEWYAPAVAWSYGAGAITGYDNGLFGPNDPLTREQFATIIWRLEGEPVGAGTLSSFRDGWSSSAYARDALRWAIGEGIILGNEGNLKPGSAITRAEAATMLSRWMG